MARKKKPPHEILPDSKYNNVLIAKFINTVMRRGKKTIARKIVYRAFDIVKEQTKKDPVEVFEQAVNNAAPLLEVRSKRVGGATYQSPPQNLIPRQ